MLISFKGVQSLHSLLRWDRETLPHLVTAYPGYYSKGIATTDPLSLLLSKEHCSGGVGSAYIIRVVTSLVMTPFLIRLLILQGYQTGFLFPRSLILCSGHTEQRS